MSRPLTERERAVLDALLAVDFDGVDLFRGEAETAEVVGGCACGCPSIDFYRPSISDGLEVLVNATVSGHPREVFVFAKNGHLAGIELVVHDEEVPTELPAPTDIVMVTAAR